jgi:hypothetical protein
MFNLHQNLFVGAGSAIELLSDLVKQPERLPHGDLILMQIVSEDPDYLDMWGTVLASGVKRVTTMGTDCHRNTFPQLMPDGERVDSYRRMMRFFSNHLLTRGGSTYDDTDLKEALRSGRLYGSFDMVGYPDGFDFHARAGGETLEMGDEATLSDGVTLEVTMPAVLELDPAGPQPELTARLLKANTGGWTEVAKDSGDLSFTPTEPGAYRAEIRMKAHHLESYLGGYDALADRDLVWVYSNPIYVVDAAP